MDRLGQWLGRLQQGLEQARYRALVTVELGSGIAEELRRRVEAACADGLLVLDGARVHTNEARRLLGREFPLVWLRLEQPPAPDLLAILAGTLKAGGILVAEIGKERWQGCFDDWLRQALTSSEEVFRLEDGQPLPAIPPWPASQPPVADELGALTPAQHHAVKAVLRVAEGHRRRPLVIRAGRGRGKSAALGLAAAELLRRGSARIGVTAPQREAVSALMRAARERLPGSVLHPDRLDWQGREIRFWPPDRLLAEKPALELLLVDEAAALPAALLRAMAENHARIAFSTTTHGYEGSGRGFDVRFLPWLTERFPGWREVSLTGPVRWAEGDPLEHWLDRTLLLDAKLQQIDPEQCAGTGKVTFEAFSGEALLAARPLLAQAFALLVTAHYQTSPNDLRTLLQGEGAGVALACCGDVVVGVVFWIDEPPLDDDLVTAVWLGRRRPPGALLQQTLVAQAGWKEAGALAARRIVRIAVHPDLRRRGVGRGLLEWLAQRPDADWLGSSFAVDEEVLPFWMAAGYRPLRLGLRADTASGAPALLVGRALTERADSLLAKIALEAGQDFVELAPLHYRALAPELLAALLVAMAPQERPEKRDWAEAVAFALGGRGLEQARGALKRLVLTWFARLPAAERSSLVPLMSLLLLRQRTEEGERFGWKGRREALAELRGQARRLLLAGPLQAALEPELRALLLDRD